MRNRRTFAVIAVLILVGGFLFIRNKQSTENQTIETAKVKRGTLEETLTLSGSVDAQEKAALTFQAAGRLAYVGVKEGDTVKKGQLIASLDVRSVKKNLQKELNDFVKTRNDLDQIREDNKSVVMTDTIKRLLENTQYDVNNAIIDVELQSIAVQYASLVSPINGIMTRVYPAQPGVNVTPTNATYEVINPDSIYFIASIDQTEVVKISEGMKANVVVDAFPNDEIEGTIDTISFVPVQGETGTVYSVKVDIKNSNTTPKYRLAMTGDAKLITNKAANVLYLPFVFIKEDSDGRQFVYTQKDKKTKKYITTGIETEESVEIKTGLTEGITVYD